MPDRTAQRPPDGPTALTAASAPGHLDIVLCQQLPQDAPGATFDSGLYFSVLRRLQGGSLVRAQDDAAGAASLPSFVWGAPLLYAEVITSTQTLLER